MTFKFRLNIFCRIHVTKAEEAELVRNEVFFKIISVSFTNNLGFCICFLISKYVVHVIKRKEKMYINYFCYIQVADCDDMVSASDK